MNQIEGRCVAFEAPTLKDSIPDPHSMEEEIEERDLLDYIFTILIDRHIHIPQAANLLRLNHREGLKLHDAGKKLGIVATENTDDVEEICHIAMCALRELVRRSKHESIQ